MWPKLVHNIFSIKHILNGLYLMYCVLNMEYPDPVFITVQVSLATFATYALVHQNSDNPADRLTADKVFVALSLFNIIRFPLSVLPMLIMSMVQVCNG